MNQHYSQLLGLGDEWKVSDVMLSMGAKRVDIYVEYAAKSAQCPHCGKLFGVHDQQEEMAFVGMDEKSFLCGKDADDYACVMTDLDNPRILDVSRGRSEEGAKALINRVLKSGLKPMIKVAKTLKRRLYGLLAWFDSRITNSVTEGYNATIQALKAGARGFRNFDNFRIVILFYCGKLDMRPDFVRVGSALQVQRGIRLPAQADRRVGIDDCCAKQISDGQTDSNMGLKQGSAQSLRGDPA